VRAARFAERTDANVAVASTSVPPAVASEEIVGQSAIACRLVTAVGDGLVLAAAAASCDEVVVCVAAVAIEDDE